MWRLLFPLKYFALHNKQKSRIDLWPTLILAALISLPYIIFPGSNYFYNDGLLDKIIPLSSALTAFYVAALVAVATFSHPDLDKVITLGSIYFIEKDERGKEEKDYLTRRQFACIIFGYLAFVSMILSVLAAIVVTTSGQSLPNLTFAIGGSTHDIPSAIAVNWAGIVFFSLLIAHMMVVTGLGLYYLMERIHAREPVVLTKKRSSPTPKPDQK